MEYNWTREKKKKKNANREQTWYVRYALRNDVALGMILALLAGIPQQKRHKQ